MSSRDEITRRGFLGTFGAGIAVSNLAPLTVQAQAPSSSRSTGTVEKDVVYANGGFPPTVLFHVSPT
jgi:hypothetical protein